MIIEIGENLAQVLVAICSAIVIIYLIHNGYKE